MFVHDDPVDLEALLGLVDLRMPAAELTALLEPHLSVERRERIEAVLDERTVNVVPVLEGLHDTGNIAAVLRTTEGLGYQCAHVIENPEGYKRSRRISRGADKWLDVMRWQDSGPCIELLRDNGYQIVVTHLDAARPLDAIDFTRKTALVFGNEHVGVSEAMLEAADARCIIPMVGFVQSFNISVAAAISLYHAYHERGAKLGRNGDLTVAQRRILRAVMYARAAQDPGRLIPRLLERSERG